MDPEEIRVIVTLTTKSLAWPETTFMAERLGEMMSDLSYRDSSGEDRTIGEHFDTTSVSVYAATGKS